jgi:hypothetical protein
MEPLPYSGHPNFVPLHVGKGSPVTSVVRTFFIVGLTPHKLLGAYVPLSTTGPTVTYLIGQSRSPTQ